MTEPRPTYNMPQAVIRTQLARRRRLINELISLERELMTRGAIHRPSIVSRRMVNDGRLMNRKPRRLDTT